MTTEKLESDPPPSKRRSLTLGGGWEVAAVFALFIVLFKGGDTFRSLLLILVVGYICAGFLRVCFHFNSKIGWLGVLLLFVMFGSVAGYQIHSHEKNEEFLGRLSAFDEIKVRRESRFPASPIEQVSLHCTINDRDLELLTAMSELKDVKEVYLGKCKVTDRGLLILDRWEKIEFVYIESELISSDAISEFENHHPECRVIVPEN